MDTLTDRTLIKFNSDTLEYVRSLYGLEKPGRIDDAVNILVEWLKKQNHFVKKDLSKEYLERTIILSKGSIETAKIRLEKSFTFKTLLPRYYEPVDLFKSPLLEHVICGILPQMTRDHYRIFMFKNSIQTYDAGFIDFYKYVVKTCEYFRANDYCNGIICIFDYYDADMIEVMKNINLVEVREILSITMEGYGVRLKGIHFMTTSKTIDLLLSVFKQAVSPKIASRIHVHKKIDTLYEFVPKDILPKDYGGYDSTIKMNGEALMNELSSKKFTKYFEEMKEARTDEALRSQEMRKNEFSGLPGSFRKLCVD